MKEKSGRLVQFTAQRNSVLRGGFFDNCSMDGQEGTKKGIFKPFLAWAFSFFVPECYLKHSQ